MIATGQKAQIELAWAGPWVGLPLPVISPALCILLHACLHGRLLRRARIGGISYQHGCNVLHVLSDQPVDDELDALMSF